MPIPSLSIIYLFAAAKKSTKLAACRSKFVTVDSGAAKSAPPFKGGDKKDVRHESV